MKSVFKSLIFNCLLFASFSRNSSKLIPRTLLNAKLHALIILKGNLVVIWVMTRTMNYLHWNSRTTRTFCGNLIH